MCQFFLVVRLYVYVGVDMLLVVFQVFCYFFVNFVIILSIGINCQRFCQGIIFIVLGIKLNYGQLISR